MRLPRLLSSVRNLMIAVVIVAVSIEAMELSRLSSEYGEKARLHASGARTYGQVPSYLSRWPNWLDTPEAYRVELLEQVGKVQAYHASLEQKYSRAARCPWLSVEPDPPMPPCDVVVSSCPL